MKSSNRRSNGQNLNNDSVTSDGGDSAKKKTKYVNLYSEDGNAKSTILLPGRYNCDCQALKHKLINNCSSCGRIVCEQEGSGPCSFCGNLVYTKAEKQILNQGTKKSETLHNILKNTKKVESDLANSLKKAVDHKNKLLEYDQTSEQRTKVYDDQSDYFQTNSKWIHPSNREKLQQLEKECSEKKHSRNHSKMTIDLLGRKVDVDKDGPLDMKQLNLEELLRSDSSNYNSTASVIGQISLERPIFVEDTSTKTEPSMAAIPMSINRIQDKEIKEMCDDGMCLSMHQPWASLLVNGIKKHEGRVWYSSHRGRLWIASASRAPIDTEVAHVESMYRSLYSDENISFPRNYPTGCLLGCVNVETVLPQEEYRTSYPAGESESPYVFVCSNPIEMMVKFPMKGEHKIFKLNSQIHKAAKSAIKELINS